MRKLLLISFLSLPVALHAAPAALSVHVSTTVPKGQNTNATIILDVGTSALGAADFTLTFDPSVVTPQALSAIANQFQNNFFFNPNDFATGRIRLIAMNDASTSNPAGLVNLANLTLDGSGIVGSATVLDAQVQDVLDTATLPASPVTVTPGPIQVVAPAAVDTSSPITTIVYSTPTYLDSGNNRFVSTSTPVGFVAVDSGTPPSGVAFTRYRIDFGTFTVFASSFTVPAGPHQIFFQSQDVVGNLEALKTAIVRVDAGAPISALSFSTAPVTPNTVIALQATDPTFLGVTSGVQEIRYSIDGAPFVVYTSTFSIPTPGTHTVQWYALDRVGNVENLRNQQVVVAPITVPDIVAPTTQILFSDAPQFVAGLSYIRGTTLVGFSATDPGSNASGVAFTRYQLNGGSFQTYVSSFTLPEGSQIIGYQSQDNAGNLESIRISTMAVDSTPPVSSIAFTPVPVTTASVVTISAVDPLSAGVASGLQQIQVSLDGGPFNVYTSSIVLPSTGTHSFQWFATDRVGNVEVTQSTTVVVAPVVIPDGIPPVTQIFYTPAPVLVSGLPYISGLTGVSFAAADFGSNTSGVAFTQYSINGAGFQTYTSTITLPEGLKQIAYRSQDNAGNLEAIKISTAAVDTTDPVTSISFSTVPVTTATPVGFVANDPVSNGVASGVAQTLFAIDGGAFNVFSGPFVIPSTGTHTVQWRSADLVGNQEITRSTTVVVVPATVPDTTAPITQINFAAIPVTTTTFVSFLATDPIMSGLASGVAQTLYAIDGGAFNAYTSSFTIPTTGIHQIQWFSTDNAGNSEVTKSTTVAVVPILPPPPPTPVGLVAKLLSPSEVGQEVDLFVSKGFIPVTGSAEGTDFASYRLLAKPGLPTDPGTIVVVATGGVPVSSSTVGTWDTRQIAGVYSLFLEVLSTHGGLLRTTSTVTVGQPSLLQSFQNPKETKFFNDPQGLALDAQGKIYVANTRNNEILKLDSAGALEARFTANFKGPSGVAVDLGGNIYVADRSNHRVVILDASGVELRSIGRFHPREGYFKGSGPGQFNFPTGLAVLANRLVVADKGNSRLQVFDPAGTFLFEIKIAGKSFSPFAVAIDANGLIYASAEAQPEIDVFSPTGAFLYSLGQPGKEGLGLFRQPQGLAISPLGSVLVADKLGNNIQRADAYKNFVSIFGGKANLTRPVGTAMGPDSRLWVTDTQKNRILQFGLTPGSFSSTGLKFVTDPKGLFTGSAGLTGSTLRASGPLDSTFQFNQVFVFPNPAKNGAVPTIHIEAGLADRVDVKIYDLAGRLLRDVTLSSLTQVDSGSGLQYAFEYPWTGHIASGVYLYHVTAHQGGRSMEKSGRFAVIR